MEEKIRYFTEAIPILIKYMEKQNLSQEVKDSWEMIKDYLEMSGILEHSKEQQEYEKGNKNE